MDPKKILGVDSNATPEQIQQAYREKAKKHHPDMGGDSWAFQQVQDAYQQLTNPKPDPTPKPQNPQPASSQSGGSHGSTASGKTKRRPNDSSNSVPSNSSRFSPNSSSGHTNRRSRNDVANSSHTIGDWKHLLSGQLPLQTETTTFILFNCLDIFLTYILLTKGAMEANPIANYFYERWEFAGAIAFKLAIVAFVTVIAQIVAIKKKRTARALLILGSIIVGCVVIYSINLYFQHYR